MKTAAEWSRILVACGVRASTADRWAPVFAAQIGPGTFSRGDDDLRDFLGQILHESAMLERVEESLTYTTAARLCEVWPKRFPTPDAARPYVRNPVALANVVYGGRMGNTQLGDGWRYRGRGLMQVTGRDNYRTVGRAIGVDLEGNPDLLARPDIALQASIAWWERNIPDAALGDVKRVTRLVNGGTSGIAHRDDLTGRAERALA